MLKLLGVLVLAASLVGCSSVKQLEYGARPQTSSGYVGGNFTLTNPTFATAFVFTNMDTGSQHTLAFTAKREVLAGNNETVLIELPRGNYRATHWTVFNAHWGPGAQEFKKALTNSRLTEPFRIEGGEVVFLGKFSAGSTWSGGMMGSTTYGEWRRLDLTGAEARRLLATSYPEFAAQKFVCIVCDPD